MKRTNIYLAEGQADALDRVAQAAGLSRAELIRELIDRAIGGHPGADLVADLAAIDRSFGILAGEAKVRCQRTGGLAGSDAHARLPPVPYRDRPR